MSEDEKMRALPALRQQLQANPYYAMVVEQEGDQYLLDWMTVCGSQYEPQSPPTGTDNFEIL